MMFLLPKGFKTAGEACGIKHNNKKDLGLIVSTTQCVVSAAFTKNKVQAAPVSLSKKNIKQPIRALIVNSGNANCFTGKNGIRDVQTVIKTVASALSVNPRNVLVASTGIIGVPLPVKKITDHIPALVEKLSESGGASFATSLLTTDTFSKKKSIALTIGKKSVMISGFAKGAGMIYPQMEVCRTHATMLAFIVTDAAIARPLLEKAFQRALVTSFNRISIDGCMSTNDTVFVLSNGQAQNKKIIQQNADFKKFTQALSSIMLWLAKMIVLDGEGATKFVTVSVSKAKDQRQAQAATRAIANSALVKAALYGESSNWGRVVAALGAAGIELNEEKIDIYYNNRPIVKKGKPVSLAQKKLLKGKKEISLEVVLHQGSFSDTFYTCDLTPQYVNINAHYS